MLQLKQKKSIKAAMKRLIMGVVLRAIYIYFGVADKINNIIIITVTPDPHS